MSRSNEHGLLQQVIDSPSPAALAGCGSPAPESLPPLWPPTKLSALASRILPPTLRQRWLLADWRRAVDAPTAG